MIDTDGYRRNAAIILVNQENKVFWAQRMHQPEAWQFPQGGMQDGETPEQSMYRELEEELGLVPEDVELLATSKDWYFYDLPRQYRRLRDTPVCIGQKQRWFLLRLAADESKICFTKTNEPEFEVWQWVDYWYPINHIIDFKQDVYKRALNEFAPLLFATV